MFRSITLFAALALAFSLTLAAAPTLTADQAAAQSEAVALRASADNLLMLARTPMKHSFEAHASELDRARTLADRIGETPGAHERPACGKPRRLRLPAWTPCRRNCATWCVTPTLRFRHSTPANGTAKPSNGENYQSPVRSLFEGARALANPTVSAAVAAD